MSTISDGYDDVSYKDKYKCRNKFPFHSFHSYLRTQNACSLIDSLETSQNYSQGCWSKEGGVIVNLGLAMERYCLSVLSFSLTKTS